MKQLIQLTKDTLPKVISATIKPEKPHPNSCCGCGCGDICVWVPYYKAMKEYEEILNLNEFKEQKINIKDDC
jgi:hypothetical protein